MTSLEIRAEFLDFFASKSHKIVASAPIVIKNDPTLMFTNAGMNQFKDYFLGQKKIDVSRIADTQKCLRVSGKHNDLEEVGIDTYHHTMFEMLGNWSFGDYFKKEAIAWAWELLTEVLKIDKDSLYVTVFEGAEDENLDFDQEAFDYWSKLIDKNRIINGNKKDNFWEMGAQGPCGPCSEIHVDIRSAEEKKKVSGKDLVNKDHPQVVEIWNLVFMEYNRKADGSLEKLPAKHVDTGMGFERLCMVLQGKQSNYDTDLFKPLIQKIETVTNTAYGKNDKTDIAIRVIADHVRAVAFSIADGQLPSNNGAGYVIRRILRRAIRYGYTFLNQKEPFIYQLSQVLAEEMGEAFPEIRSQNQLIQNVIREEENSFLRTLEQGLVILDQIIESTKDKVVSGKKCFELYDTYGFPIDLTALILRENDLTYDQQSFHEEMKKQKERSREAAAVDTEDWVILVEDESEEFVGYDFLETEIKITRYRKITSKKEGTMYQLVFNLTPFYPEGGGQVGDKGYIESSDGEKISILDTKKENNLILHFSKELPKRINQTFRAVVNDSERFRTACNHSATHLLHEALRAVLGDHVTQKGSAVHSKNLRFDFSHFSKLTEDELKKVETFVNEKISENLALEEYRNLPMEEASKQGAMMLFGEKYGDTVRMIRFGNSVELCGGTHVKNTGDIWYFKIVSESAIAAGIRRIEAITNEAVKSYFLSQDNILQQIKEFLKHPASPIQTVQNLQEENISLKKEIESLYLQKAQSLKTELVQSIENIGGTNFLTSRINMDSGTIKNMAFELGNEVEKLFFINGAEMDGKAFLTVFIDKQLVKDKGLNAGKIVREMGKLINGGGGGQDFFATAGGKNPSGIDLVLTEVKKYLD